MIARIAAGRVGAPVSRKMPAAARNRLLTQSAAPRASVTDKAKQAADSVQQTAQHAGKGSDTPWIVGSLLVFVPLTVYITSPSETKHAVAKKLPSNMKNYGMSREPDPVKEDDDPDAQPSDPSEDSGTPQSDAEFAEASEQDAAEGDVQRPFQGEESLKTSRHEAPQGTTLEKLHTPDDDAVHAKHTSSKGAATLQPRPGKLDDAIQLAKDGHHHSPITGLAEQEKKNSERSGEQEKPPHSKDNLKNAPSSTNTKKEEGAQ